MAACSMLSGLLACGAHRSQGPDIPTYIPPIRPKMTMKRHHPLFVAPTPGTRPEPPPFRFICRRPIQERRRPPSSVAMASIFGLGQGSAANSSEDGETSPMPGGMPPNGVSPAPPGMSPLDEGLNFLGKVSMDVITAPIKVGEGVINLTSDVARNITAELDGTAAKEREQRKSEEAAIAMQKIHRGRSVRSKLAFHRAAIVDRIAAAFSGSNTTDEQLQQRVRWL